MKYFIKDEKGCPWQNPLISLDTAKLIPNAKQSPWWLECDWFYIDTKHKDGYWMATRNDPDVDYPRPTQALLQRHLRKIYNIDVRINYGDYNRAWSFQVESINLGRRPPVRSDYKYVSPEEALDEGLQEGLKLIL